MILPGCEDPRNHVDPRKERVRPKVGRDRVCIFVVSQDEMKMRCCLSTLGSPEYILGVSHSPSVTPVCPYTQRRAITIYLEAVIDWVWRCTGRRWLIEFGDTLGGRDGVNSQIHWEAVIEQVWRCPWRPRLSQLTDSLGGRNRASLDMHLEAEIEWTKRCTGRPWSSEFGDALGGRGWVNSEMHFEAVIEWVWRCNWRPESSELRDALWGCDQASLEMHLHAMIERDWRSTWRQSIWREERRQVRLYSLVNLSLDQKLAGSERLSILGWCCT